MSSAVQPHPSQGDLGQEKVSSEKLGILLLNLGGPDSLDAVQPFLYNLFADPDIFRLPFSFITQRLFATVISSKRAPEAQKNYAHMGGRSPILPLTETQAHLLKTYLGDRGHTAKIYIGMRYWHPFLQEAVAQILADNVTHLLVLPLYPQYSHTTTGSSLNELQRQFQRQRPGWKEQIKLTVINNYHDHPRYLKALASTIAQGLQQHEWNCPPEQVNILFSAHSLPRRFVKRTKDPYPQQIEASARQVMEQFFPKNPWVLAYQSKVGRMVWLGPQTDGMLHYFAATDEDNILMVPISFVSDHVETLVEIDMEYLELAHELGLKYCHRAPAFNDNPLFIEALGELTLETLRQASVPSLLVS
ncbi:MAG: ferrochelatase [Candidatus Melainabacteria bacterium]|nr:ferrochelatase [Candidatus Melainabacteria bacterium]